MRGGPPGRAPRRRRRRDLDLTALECYEVSANCGVSAISVPWNSKRGVGRGIEYVNPTDYNTTFECQNGIGHSTATYVCEKGFGVNFRVAWQGELGVGKKVEVSDAWKSVIDVCVGNKIAVHVCICLPRIESAACGYRLKFAGQGRRLGRWTADA